MAKKQTKASKAVKNMMNSKVKKCPTCGQKM